MIAEPSIKNAWHCGHPENRGVSNGESNAFFLGERVLFLCPACIAQMRERFYREFLKDLKVEVKP